MGPVQRTFDAVEPNPQARLRQRLGRRAQVVEQRLDLAPLDVPADRILENRSEQVFVFAAHRGSPRAREYIAAHRVSEPASCLRLATELGPRRIVPDAARLLPLAPTEKSDKG